MIPFLIGFKLLADLFNARTTALNYFPSKNITVISTHRIFEFSESQGIHEAAFSRIFPCM